MVRMLQTALPLEPPYKRLRSRSPGVTPIGTIRERRDPSGALRAWVKVAAQHWRPRAVLIYELHHGPVPPGCVVHHRDRCSLNDDPDNLVALTRADHAAEHAYAPAVVEQRSRSLWLAL
jgi:hypothetical protein